MHVLPVFQVYGTLYGIINIGYCFLEEDVMILVRGDTNLYQDPLGVGLGPVRLLRKKVMRCYLDGGS